MRAFVLSGGGSRGALQAGALEVLLAAGIVPELLVGTSVGALNAAHLAAEPTPARAALLVDLWRTIRPRSLFPSGSRLVQLANLVRGADHVGSSTPLRHLIEDALPYRQIEDAAMPLVVVATDLRTGTERHLSRGSVVDAVLASAAIPGVYAPVPWGDDLLVDGGVLANLPIHAAIAAGGTDLWLLDTTQPCTNPRPTRNAIDIALQSLALSSAARTRAELARKPPSVTLHHVPLACARHHRLTDLRASTKLLAEGAAATRRFLASATSTTISEGPT
ncbi:MAG: patatin-like phospholipase family protein [Actinomycetota bacterium]